MANQLVDQFLNKPRSYSLLNSGEKELRARALGQLMILPPTNVVGSNPAYYEGTEDPIPGSAVFSDIMKKDKQGNISSVPEWSAATAVKVALGIDVKTGLAISDYAKQGLSILVDFDKPSVERLRAEGYKRWKEFQLKLDRDTVSAYDSKVEVYKRIGAALPTPDEAYIQAITRLRVHDDAFLAGLNGRPAASQAPSQAEEEVSDVDFLIYAKEKAQEAAGKATTEQNLEALAEQLVQDPNFLKLVAKKYKTREKRTA